MANYIRQIRQHDRLTGRTHIQSTEVVEEPITTSGITRLQAFVYYVSSLLSIALFIRFALALFGANPNAAFVQGMYSVTEPFVAPFQGIFGTTLSDGAPHFEVETIVALIAYMVLAWVIISALALLHRDINDVDLDV